MSKKFVEIQPIFLTKEKIAEIIEELHLIDTVILPEIRKRMSDAYEDGDIPENNPWLTANDDLNNAMKRKNELRNLHLRAKKYKPNRKSGILHLGSNVIIRINEGTEQAVTLVASEEANPLEGKMSIDSPIGKALLGKKPEVTFFVETPSGKTSITVLKKL